MTELLLFNCPKSLENLLSMLNISYKTIDKNYQNNKLIDLLTNEDNLRTNSALNFKESLIVFNDFSDIQLEDILYQLKANNINVDLKCIVTDTNKNWKIIKLYDELLKEKKAMQKHA